MLYVWPLVNLLQGGHRIETLLYRDNNTSAAIPWTKQLIQDYKSVAGMLNNSSDYSDSQVRTWLYLNRIACYVATLATVFWHCGHAFGPHLPLFRSSPA
jgi:hypothetical protein